MTAREKGYQAFFEDVDLRDNPFDEETEEQNHQEWINGWLAAEAEFIH